MNPRLLVRSMAMVLLLAASLRADEERERDEDVLRSAGIAVEGDPLLDYFRRRYLTEQEREQFVSLIRRLGDESFRVRETANDELEKHGLKIIALLKQQLDNTDPEIARRCRVSLGKLEKVPTETVSAAAARMLGRLKPPGTMALLLAQLPLAEDDYVADAMRWSLAQIAVSDGKADPALVEALGDALPVRRAAAAEALIRGGAKLELPQIRSLLKDKEIEVRLRTVSAMILYARDKDVVPELINLLPSLPLTLGWQAEEVLYRIAGDDAPHVAFADDAAAKLRSRDAWLDWWKKNGADVNLAKLDEQPKHFGYLMVLQISQNGAGGKVIEYAPDGKTIRWQIEGLQFPICAQVLPSNRVLIAEHNTHQVTERDLQGRIHWRKQVTLPIFCQRLPSGNTFIVSRNQVVEVARDGKEVFRIDRPNNDIIAGARTRDGQALIATQAGTILRLDQKGREVRSFQVGRMYYYSFLQPLPNNRVLVTLMNGIGEYDELTGKQVWTAAVPRSSCVQRLPNGNTLSTSYLNRKVIEVDRTGKTVHEHTPPNGDMPYRAFRR